MIHLILPLKKKTKSSMMLPSSFTSLTIKVLFIDSSEYQHTESYQGCKVSTSTQKSQHPQVC